MNTIQRYALFLLLLVSFTVGAQTAANQMDTLARRLENANKHKSKTSIYLRTSKDIYESMEDLWFKAYSVDQQQHLLSDQDKTLYIQMVHMETDSIVWEEIYPIRNGIVSGHIFLDNSFKEGSYWLCAYSANSLGQRNSDFTDGRKIEIVSGIKELAEFHRKRPAANPSVSQMRFQLFAEGGLLLSDVPNRISFRAVSLAGIPVSVTGKLYEEDVAISDIASIHNGMGSFFLLPHSGKRYTVRLDPPFQDSVYALPAIQKHGLNFRLIENKSDSLTFRLYNTTDSPQPFFFRIQTRGLPSVMASGKIRDSLTLQLPLTKVPSGISEATLFDQNLMPVAERLVYVKADSFLKITAAISKQKADKKDKMKLRLRATDEHNNPVIAQLGALVYDDLYQEPGNQQDIVTHYLLSTQIKGPVYNAAFYFDRENPDRKEAMDLLLLTQGWRAYTWREQINGNKEENKDFTLSDFAVGELLPGNGKKTGKQSVVVLFDALQQDTRLVELTQDHKFTIEPENMDIGKSMYIKHFGKQGDYEIQVIDPFEKLRQAKLWRNLYYPAELKSDEKVKNEMLFSMENRGRKLNELVVTARKDNLFRDKYVGTLDSMAKLQNNTDRVHGGWLNCPAGDGDEMPEEGKSYIVWTGPNPPTSHPFSFNSTNTERVVYKYPKFTEEELMKMFGLARAKGYYPERVFFEPDYTIEPLTVPDYRNTLLWVPGIVTDHNGEAELEFYTSDIRSTFHGLVEGISGSGQFGKTVFEFRTE